jgi:hypothetical protein
METPDRKLSLPLPFDFHEGNVPKPRTLVEQRMVRVSQMIRAKTGWTPKKVEHEATWLYEALQTGLLSQKALDHVMAELSWYIGRRECVAVPDGPDAWLEPAAVDGTWQADGLVPTGLRALLRAEVAKLEAGPADWHPGSGGVVRDLVHPSLYCLVLGESRIFGAKTFTEGIPLKPPFRLPFGHVWTVADVDTLLGAEETYVAEEIPDPDWSRALLGTVFNAVFDAKGASAPTAGELAVIYTRGRPGLIPKLHAIYSTTRSSMMWGIDDSISIYQPFKKNQPEPSIQDLANMYTSKYFSGKYAWLPSEFQVDAEGGVSILSYINNLHPCYRKLYEALAAVFAAQLPLFERVLGELAARSRRSRIPEVSPDWYPVPTLGEWLAAKGWTWERLLEELNGGGEGEGEDAEDYYEDEEGDEDETPEEAVATLLREDVERARGARLAAATIRALDVEHTEGDGYFGAENGPTPDRPDKEHALALPINCPLLAELLDYYEGEGCESLWEEGDRTPTQPVPPLFEKPDPVLPYVLRGRRLQVIVKLANIELTPEKPRYEGGVWHVEGMLNERIVATGLYYYSNENVTAPGLSFREAVAEPDYEQNDEKGVEQVFGLRNEDPLVQELGAVETLEGRSLVFPNIFQHRVGPCELVDETRRGCRRILAFFLVDPDHRVVSTLFVPPQQPSWFMWMLRKESPVFAALPLDVIVVILSFLAYPMSVAAAHAHRDQLMAERKMSVNQVTKELFEREFSLCEH